VVFVGPSGCGKSTLLRLIAGLEDLSSGKIVIDDRDATAVPPAKRRLAMVFQSDALYPHMSVRNNIAFPMKMAGMPQAEQDRRIASAAKALNLTDDLVAVPGYARTDLSPGIVHSGVGNFHRAHTAVYLDRLFSTGEGHDWAIVGAGVKSFDAARRSLLQAQDWLTTVVGLSPEALTFWPLSWCADRSGRRGGSGCEPRPGSSRDRTPSASPMRFRRIGAPPSGREAAPRCRPARESPSSARQAASRASRGPAPI